MSKGYKEIHLDGHRCDTGVSFHVVFSGVDWDQAERNAVEWFDRKKSVLAINWDDEAHPLPDIDEAPLTALWAKLDPNCPHGMSMRNCYGPQHYYFDEEEQAHGRRNGW